MEKKFDKAKREMFYFQVVKITFDKVLRLFESNKVFTLSVGWIKTENIVDLFRVLVLWVVNKF